MISQARRGSLPYPPPNIVHHGVPPVQPGRIVGPSPTSSYIANRPNIPLHVAVAVNNGRRASLPGNSPLNLRSSASGSPMMPMSMRGAGRQLNIIQDHEEYVNTDLALPLEATLELPSALPSGSTPGTGPLPNPGFSFGNANLDMSDPNNFNTLQDNMSPLSSMSSNLVSPTDFTTNFNSYVARGRMGSMASILSLATTDAGTEPGSSDWERALPPMPYVYQQPGMQVGIQGEEDKNPFLAGYGTRLSPGFQMAPGLDRRASA